jgi:hypothetical protein
VSTPPEKLAESIGHDCQSGCGARADVVMVQLATGETDILCQPCLVAMMTAVITAVAETVPAEDEDPHKAANEAIAAANEALDRIGG